MTNPSPRISVNQGVEEVARLIEESSLGTVGARQLRDRSADHAPAIRARAYFAASTAGRSWWRANQHSPEALCAKARELAAVDPEISDVLVRLAYDRQAELARQCWYYRWSWGGTRPLPISLTRFQEAARGLETFQDFHSRERETLTVIVCQQADLPVSLGQKLIRRAMAEAFDNWEQLVAIADPGEWVVGRALQLHRSHRRPGTEPLPGFRSRCRAVTML